MSEDKNRKQKAVNDYGSFFGSIQCMELKDISLQEDEYLEEYIEAFAAKEISPGNENY